MKPDSSLDPPVVRVWKSSVGVGDVGNVEDAEEFGCLINWLRYLQIP